MPTATSAWWRRSSPTPRPARPHFVSPSSHWIAPRGPTAFWSRSTTKSATEPGSPDGTSTTPTVNWPVRRRSGRTKWTFARCGARQRSVPRLAQLRRQEERGDLLTWVPGQPVAVHSGVLPVWPENLA
jgi:hypothetical protein